MFFHLLALSLFPFFVEAATVDFVAKAVPAILKVKGHIPVIGSPLLNEGGNFAGPVEVDLTKITTGIELRDDHLKEKYLDVKTFSKSTLTISSTLQEIKN